MQLHAKKQGEHSHEFAITEFGGERRTRNVMLLTTVTMVAEIAAGTVYGSMALLADGWHMGTHVAAFAIALFAYGYARRHATSGRFSFGTGKVSVLGGYTSAIVLVIVACLMVYESATRLISATPIQFNQAIAVAVIGLIVNLVSAWMLQGGHDHGHEHPATGKDHNLRAAYLHVLTDALTSVTAIIALVCGKYLGWMWMDPLMGIVGAIVIIIWAKGLLRDTSGILLDKSEVDEVADAITQVIQTDSHDVVADMHVWHIGSEQMAGIISITSDNPKPPAHYKQLLMNNTALVHVTVEVNKYQADVK